MLHPLSKWIVDPDGCRVSKGGFYLRPNLLQRKFTICSNIYAWCDQFFPFRGEVEALLEPMPLYTYFDFFSAGFKICRGSSA